MDKRNWYDELKVIRRVLTHWFVPQNPRGGVNIKSN